MTDFTQAYTELYSLQNTTAHILACAVKNLFPSVKLLEAKASEKGFSYSFYFTGFTDTFLDVIERKMQEMIKENHPIGVKTMVYLSAQAYLKHLGLQKTLPKDAESTFIEIGEFRDLSKPYLLSSTQEVSCFILEGGRKKGSGIIEIYGYSFFSKKDYKEYKKNTKNYPNFREQKILKGEDVCYRHALISSWYQQMKNTGCTLTHEIFNKQNLHKNLSCSSVFTYVEEVEDKNFGLLDTDIKTQSTEIFWEKQDLFSYLQSVMKYLNILGLDSFSVFHFAEAKRNTKLLEAAKNANITWTKRIIGGKTSFLVIFIYDRCKRPWKVWEIKEEKKCFTGKIVSFERILGLLEEKGKFFLQHWIK